MSKILVSGVNGFIGRNAARFFNSRGFTVHGFDVGPQEHAPLGDLAAYHQLRLPSEDFGNLLDRVEPDLMIHCAGRASVPLSVTDPRTDFYSGPVLTWEVLDALRTQAPRCKFVFLSSAAVYGSPGRLPITEGDKIQPISPYGSHKHMSELIGQEFASIFGLRVASIRIFSAYGPGLRRQVMWDLCHQALQKGRIEAQGTGNEGRDFIHVRDICEALAIVAAKAPMEGEVYNLGSGQETTIHDLAGLIIRSLGVSCPVGFAGVIPPGTPLNWRADITRLSALGFRPTVDIPQGVASYATWCRAELH